MDADDSTISVGSLLESKAAKNRHCPSKKPHTEVRGFEVGWLMGLEPTTLGTTNRCSNQLSYSLRFTPKGAQR